MRRGFAGHIQPLCPCLADECHAFLCGDVADMIFHAGFLYQLQISLNLLPFAFGADTPMPMCLCIFALMNIAARKQGIILAVRGNNFVVSADFFHCFTHDFIILHTTPIIRKGADIIDDFVIRRQFLPLFAYRNRAVGDNLNAGGFADCL